MSVGICVYRHAARALTTLAVVFILFTSPASAGYNQWTITGPDWANSLVVEVNPDDTDIIYGTGADPTVGLFISSDGASSWSLANEGLGIDSGNAKRMSAFALDATDPSNLYCAITDDAIGSEDYVFRSTDGGSSWERVLESEGPINVDLGCIDAYGGTVYVGAEKSLYRTDDFGGSWELVYTFSRDIRSLAIDPVNPNTIYVAASGVYKSVDGGSNFEDIGFSGNFVTYTGVHNVGASTFITVSIYGGEFYISSDGGENWNLLNSGLPGSPYDVAFSPNIANCIYAAVSFGGIYKTIDGGLNWVNSQGDIENPYSVGGLESMLGVNITCCDDGGSDVIYLASNWGIHRSESGGTNWEVVGVPGQLINSLDFTGTGPYNGLAGCGLGVFAFNSPSWSETSFMGEIGAGITCVAIDPGDDQTLLAGGPDAMNYARIVKSSNGGADWTTVYGMGQECGSISNIVYDHTNPSRVFVTICVTGGFNDGALLFSTDGGDSFTQDPYFDDTPLTGLAISVSDSDYMYICGYYGGVWASSDGGSSWTAKTGTGIINRVITVDPDDPQRIYIGGQDETEALFISDDGGTQWSAGGYGGGLIKSIEFAGNTIILGAYGDGAYYGSSDGDWTPLNDGLSNRRVNDIWAFDNDSEITVYAATSGAGVYHIELDYLGIDVDNLRPSIAMGYSLHQSYPNPAYGTATISFALTETAVVSLSVYDITGRRIATLADETLMEGEYERSVSDLPSGIYLYRLVTGDFTASKKMIVY